MSPALSRYLKDFGVERPAPPAFDAEVSFESPAAFQDVHEEPAVDLDAERRHAFSQGYEAGTRAVSRTHEAALAEQAAAHAADIDNLRTQFEVEAAETIAASLKQMAIAIGQAVGAEASNVLAPVMTEALTRKAVADLADLVSAAILDGAVGTITIDGPHALFESLAAHLGDDRNLLRHVEAEGLDLSVTIGDSVIVTRMSAWADSLRKILA